MNNRPYSNAEDISQAASLQATNNLVAAIYNFEYKTVNNLQILNGGGAAILVGFLSKTGVMSNSNLKWFFISSIVCFVIGLLSSLCLMFTFPMFLQARHIQSSDYKKRNYSRLLFLIFSAFFFILAIILSLIGWLNIKGS